ncbi:hypothetical protein JCM6882_000919 [Rhodosporidiobolus microsporus]
MAGSHGYQPVKHDPGLESWNYMRENIWRFFRFTKTTSRQSLLWGALVPVGVFFFAQSQDLKWDVAGAKRDSPIARWGEMGKKPSERAAAAAPAEDDE